MKIEKEQYDLATSKFLGVSTEGQVEFLESIAFDLEGDADEYWGVAVDEDLFLKPIYEDIERFIDIEGEWGEVRAREIEGGSKLLPDELSNYQKCLKEDYVMDGDYGALFIGALECGIDKLCTASRL